MSISSQIRRDGDYPIDKTPTTRNALKIDNHTVIETIYETTKTVNMYLGGVKRWCIHCELIKDENNTIKETGFLIKIRYDMLCSIEERVGRGGGYK